ncbi:MAG: cupin domain-containing protein [Sandaracinaceae bacterium]
MPSEEGGAAQAPRAPATTAAPAMVEDEAAVMEQVAPAIGGITNPTRIEPQVLVPLVLEPAPEEPVRVRMARLDLPPGGAWRPSARPCEDTLVLVREGELRAVGSGIAPPEAPGTLYAGDAVRFGPEGDGLVQNLADRRARTVVAFVRPDEGQPCPEPSRPDPLVAPNRLASVRSTPPSGEGSLRVRILLDADGAGARHGGLSVLEADPGLRMPQHRHAEAAEILFVERGWGVLRIGDRAIRVRPDAAIYIPAGALHSYEDGGTEPFVAIQVFTPSGPEQRYREGT